MPNAVITGSGSYIPTENIENSFFLDHQFFGPDGQKNPKINQDIIRKFNEITCINERKYVPDHLNTSDISFLAAEQALEGIDRETLDYIIVGHNFGEVRAENPRGDMVPSIASRVKHKLRIKNPYTVAFDVLFGCPGWLLGVILADTYIKAGSAKKVLVIGAETLSRVSDPHDIDSMIYSDGAGAVLVEAVEGDAGVLSHVSRSDTYNETYLLRMGPSYGPEFGSNRLFLKMDGHEIYKYAVRHVAETVKQSLDKAGLSLNDIKKILIHQANQKMDEAILKRVFKLYQTEKDLEGIMPMTISWLGNSSVATLPTLFDLLQRGKLNNHVLHSGDIAVFASVGAGMNINALVYKMP
ncbi:MAG: ketoacyl-ACP synthase III [Thermodesulfobacteriota bacterium]